MVRIERGVNPYTSNVQGKANEPICVAGILETAQRTLGVTLGDVSLEAIYDRLEANSPRVAIIGGSPDHPAHVRDAWTSARAAIRIWQDGGVPFYFSIPVECDGTAQGTMGMSYSLQSRNAMAEMALNQMEAQCYHGAVILQSCDKQPMSLVGALALLDRVRQERGDAPVFATFVPAHVLRGGVIPEDLREELSQFADEAESKGHANIAEDLRDTLQYILQCSSNTAFQGVFERAVRVGILPREGMKAWEKRLAVNTCHEDGGICAFNGTGNSSRHLVTGLGFVHPAVELLTEPPSQEQVNEAVDALFGFCNKPEFSVANILVRNIENGVRIHSATGGSTNLLMHMVAAMVYAGYNFSLWDYDSIRRTKDVPDIFDYSLTEGRDIFVFAQQCCDGQSRGMETIFHELLQHGVPMVEDAPTVTGDTWRDRLSRHPETLSAARVEENPIILATPRRPRSGVDVFTANWFESAVCKISGMADWQLDDFDEKTHFCLYFESEETANNALLDPNLVAGLKECPDISRDDLLMMAAANAIPGKATATELSALDRDGLFDRMVEEELLRIAIVVSGQGPAAYGMPEMFTPMQHINANAFLKHRSVLISDGRFSGVSHGAAFGHVTPEAYNGGSILYLQTGDLVLLRLRERRLELLDKALFRSGRLESVDVEEWRRTRQELADERMERLQQRVRRVAPSNRMHDCTDAAHGVVPLKVWEDALQEYLPTTSPAGTSLADVSVTGDD